LYRYITSFTSDGEYVSPFDPIPDGKGVTIDKKSGAMDTSETGWYSPAFYEAFYSFYSFYGFYDFYDFYDHQSAESEGDTAYLGPDGGGAVQVELSALLTIPYSGVLGSTPPGIITS
jgi:hypothetical protein